MPNHPTLELIDVSYRAGGLTIVDRASWRVEPGQHWAVLGANGAGKTTLLRLACGYLWPNAGGTIRRCGRELADLRTLRESIGWVSSTLGGRIPCDERALDTVVSGRYAQLGLKHFGDWQPSNAEYEQARAMLADLSGTPLVEKPFGVLSQGEQQKVLIARARMAKPLLIILDEPCAGLDPAARENLLAALEALAQTPSAPSLILVTHHIEEIMPSFTHLLAIQAGQIVRNGPAAEAIDAGLLTELYNAPAAELIERNGRFWPVW
jgi:iron complex transport system ATP-binding protein